MATAQKINKIKVQGQRKQIPCAFWMAENIDTAKKVRYIFDVAYSSNTPFAEPTEHETAAALFDLDCSEQSKQKYSCKITNFANYLASLINTYNQYITYNGYSVLPTELKKDTKNAIHFLDSFWRFFKYDAVRPSGMIPEWIGQLLPKNHVALIGENTITNTSGIKNAYIYADTPISEPFVDVTQLNIPNEKWTIGMMKYFPNVKYLTICKTSTKSLADIVRHFPELTHIDVHNLTDDSNEWGTVAHLNIGLTFANNKKLRDIYISQSEVAIIGDIAPENLPNLSDIDINTVMIEHSPVIWGWLTKNENVQTWEAYDNFNFSQNGRNIALTMKTPFKRSAAYVGRYKAKVLVKQ